jgi:hypothetical protein
VTQESRKSTDWEAVERIVAGCTAALNSLFGGNEKGVIEEILTQIDLGVIPAAYDWPEIIRVEREFPVPRGRIDILLFHVDGSLTAIECKASDKAREVLPAVGQVMAYGLMLGYSQTASKIRLAIASRARAATLAPYRQLFRQTGIEPIFAGMHAEWARAFATESLIKMGRLSDHEVASRAQQYLNADPFQLKV